MCDPLCNGCIYSIATPLLFKDCERCKSLLIECPNGQGYYYFITEEPKDDQLQKRSVTMDAGRVIRPLQAKLDEVKADGLDVMLCSTEIIENVISLLKEQEERKGNYVPCKVKTPTGKWNGEKCSVCGTEYIGSASHQWKFCPDCGAKMEGR